MFKQVLIKYTAAILLLCIISLLDAEEIDPAINSKQIRFSFSPVLYDNLKINNHGKKHIKSYPCFSGELDILYYHPIKYSYGIALGVGIGLFPDNVHYKFKLPPATVWHDLEEADASFYDYFIIGSNFRFSINKIFKKYVNIEIGVKYNKIYSYPFEISGSESVVNENLYDSVMIFDYTIEDAGDQVIISYFIKFGIIKITKNRNTVHLNFIANYSPTILGEGEYKYYNLGYESYGTLEQNINYIGFELAWGITLPKRSNK